MRALTMSQDRCCNILPTPDNKTALTTSSLSDNSSEMFNIRAKPLNKYSKCTAFNSKKKNNYKTVIF